MGRSDDLDKLRRQDGTARCLTITSPITTPAVNSGGTADAGDKYYMDADCEHSVWPSISHFMNIFHLCYDHAVGRRHFGELFDTYYTS